MTFDQDLASRVRPLLAGRPGYSEKRMFGGIAFLLDGNMCVGIWKQYLILRLGQEQGAKALEQPLVKPFDVTGRPMKGWVMVEDSALGDFDTLREWINQAVRFVRTLPRK